MAATPLSVSTVFTLQWSASPSALAINSNGTIFFTDNYNLTKLQQFSNGTVSTFAGSGLSAITNANRLNAAFKEIKAATVDANNNIFVADKFCVRKITPQGDVSTIAGNGLNSGTVDGDATTARFTDLYGIAVNSAGDIFVTEKTTVRKIVTSATGAVNVSTFAGNNKSSIDYPGEGIFDDLRGIAIDTNGNVYVADFVMAQQIFKITPNGGVSAFAGVFGTSEPFVDNATTTATFNRPFGIVIDSNNNLFVSESTNRRIRKITPSGHVSTIIGNGASGTQDGPIHVATFSNPRSLTIDSTGSIYVAEITGSKIRKITGGGLLPPATQTASSSAAAAAAAAAPSATQQAASSATQQAASSATQQGASSATQQRASSATQQGASSATQQRASSATQQGASSATQQGASSATQQGASSATQQGASSATQQGASSATQQGASSATQQRASSATQQGASSATQQGASSATQQAAPSAARPSAAAPSAAQPSAAQPSAAAPSAATPSAARSSSAAPAATIQPSGPFDPTIFPADITVPEDEFYDFNDGFIYKTESELRALSFDQLAAYSSTISTSASLQNSTITGNRILYTYYDTLLQISDSTISGLGREIQTNDGLSQADIIALGLLVNQSTQYYLSISQYDSTLSSQQKALQEYQSTIDGLNKALSTLNEALELEDAQYISSARGYSTLYYVYEGWQRQLDRKRTYVYGTDKNGNVYGEGYGEPQAGGSLEADTEIQDYTDIQSGGALSFVQIVSSGALAEKKAYDNYLVSTATWTSISLSLSTLNRESIQIQSNLTQYAIDEAQAEQDYTSTIIGLSTLSSLYFAAIANENYALALSSLTFADEKYTDALLTFEKADLLYSRSLPSGASVATGGGKNTVKKGGAASAAVLGDSALWAARSMAQQALTAAENKKISAEQVANTMQTLAQISESDLYDVVLYGLEQTIMSKIRFIDTIETQKASTMTSLNRWSSIYETAVIDYNTFDKQLTNYSTLYESSIIGNSTLQGRANSQYLEIQKKQSQAGAYSNTINTLKRQYNENMSSMHRYSTLSSLYMAQYWSSVYGLSTLSSLYYYRNRDISIWNSNVRQTQINNVTNIVKYFVYSSMFKLDSITLDGYDAQIKDTVNKEEYSAYLYRNTFCRERLLSYQTSYETGVVGAINVASNATELALATARLTNPSATVTAIPVNLSVDSVVIPFNNINAMAPFVSSFTNIYSAYDRQTSNIYNLSTVIGRNKESWSTFSFFNNKNFYSQITQADTNILINALQQTGYNDQNIALNLPPSQYQTLANTAFTSYSQTQRNVLLAKTEWNTQQERISILKRGIQTEYANFFTPQEISSQESTISSFIKVGVRSGLIALSNAGIIFNM